MWYTLTLFVLFGILLFFLNHPLLYFLFLGGLWVVWWLPHLFIENLSILYPSVIFSMRKGTDEKSRKIYLTIDDAPYSPETFSTILDILQKYNLKETFFVICGEIYHDPIKSRLLIRALKEGHRLGNHGMYDQSHFLLSPEELGKEVDVCEEFLDYLYAETGIERKKKYYRPGCGLFHADMIKFIEKKGLKMVLGSVYPHDPIFRSPTINEWYINSHLQPDDILIIHDRKWTIPLLERIGKRLSTEFETEVLE